MCWGLCRQPLSVQGKGRENLQHFGRGDIPGLQEACQAAAEHNWLQERLLLWGVWLQDPGEELPVKETRKDCWETSANASLSFRWNSWRQFGTSQTDLWFDEREVVHSCHPHSLQQWYLEATEQLLFLAPHDWGLH